MPNKEESAARHRMVVEEIEVPEKASKNEEVVASEEPRPDILDEGVKVSSQELVEESKPVEEKVVRPIQYEPEKIKKDGSPVLWILIPGIFILGAILGGVVFYQKGVNTIDTKDIPTPISTLSPSVSPSPTPAANIDVSKFDVAVFNGSGIAGEAGKAKDLLTKAGFSVTSTANAATYDYTKTIIKTKETVDASVIQKIKDALSKNYVIGESQTLAATATTDIQIIVGSSKAE